MIAALLRGLAGARRFMARFSLAVRFWVSLGYTWRLAWIKAERS